MRLSDEVLVIALRDCETVAAVLTVVLVLFSIVTSGAFMKASSSGVTKYVWPMFKHDIRRTGFVNIKPYWHFKGFYVEWSFQANFCISSNPVIADVNNDGRNEVLVSSCDGNFYVVNGSNGKILWKIYTGGRHATPAVGDVNGDGIPDVVVGGEEGNLYVLRGTDGKVEWFKRGEFIDARPAIYDFLGKGKDEIVVGSINGNLYMYRWDGKLLWKDSFLSGIVLAPSIGDVDGDGRAEIVIAAGSYVFSLNPLNGKVKGKVNVRRPAVPSVALTDINGDGALDGILCLNNGVTAIDFKHEKILWTKPLGSITFSSPSIGKVIPNTTEPQVVVGTPGGIFVLNITNGKILWKYPYLQITEGAGPAIGDVDGDGINEIIAGDARGVFVVLDTINGLKYYRHVSGAIRDPPAIGDADSDGLPEILFGSRDHHLYCLHGNLTYMYNSSTTFSLISSTTPKPNETVKSLTSTSSATIATTISIVTNLSSQMLETQSRKTNTSTLSNSPPPFAPNPGPNTPLIIAVLIGSIIFIGLTYYYTRR